MCSWAAISANMPSRLASVSVLESAKDLQGTRQGAQDQMAVSTSSAQCCCTLTCLLAASAAPEAPLQRHTPWGPVQARGQPHLQQDDLLIVVKWLADHCRGQMAHQCP